MFPQELHRPVGFGDAEVHDALFQDLLDVVLLNVQLASFQALVFFSVAGGGGGGRHLGEGQRMTNPGGRGGGGGGM